MKLKIVTILHINILPCNFKFNHTPTPTAETKTKDKEP